MEHGDNMQFLKKYWYLMLVTLITMGIGVVAYLTSIKLEQREPVAPTVPQVTPKASDVNCKLIFTLGVDNTPTPTPTVPVTGSPTPTQTPGPTASPTPSPTVTPTPVAGNTNPVCVDLIVNPATGTVPYTVTLTCTGRDNDGDITAAEFTMPDGSTKMVEQNVGSPGSLTTTYTVTTSGAYSFSCRVRDNNNVWIASDNCRVSSGATPPPGTTATPTPIPTPKIPVAGTPSVLGASIVTGGILLLLLGLVF